MLLIIDDEPMLAELLDGMARGIEHKTLLSLQELKNLPEDIFNEACCVISDMNLGNGDTAFDVLKYIKDKNPKIRVGLMTGSKPEPEIADQFDGVILKPFNKEEFIKTCLNIQK